MQMRSKILMPVWCILFFCQVARAADVNRNVVLNPDSILIIQKNDSLYIDCVFEYDKKLKSGETVEIVPTLIAGHNFCVLDKIVLNGSMRRKVYKRQLALMSKAERAEFENSVYSENSFRKDEKAHITYNLVLPYENWMAEAVLRIYESNCFCGESILEKEIKKKHQDDLSDEQVYAMAKDYPTRISLEKDRFMRKFAPQIAFIKPELYAFDDQKLDYQVRFEYKTSLTRFDSSAASNAESFNELSERLGILLNGGAQIKDIRISGYASPEGLYAINDRIARERANRFKAELSSRFSLDNEIMHVESTAEDWDGLRNILQAESPDFKTQALAIIDTYGVFDGREKKLMELNNGTSYLFMLEHYFPQLRRVEFQIKYSDKVKSIFEIKNVFKDDPATMSLNDLNRLLLENEPGTDAYAMILRQIRISYPGDETALLNEAALALNAGDMKKGEELLNKKRSKRRYPEYENNKALLLLYEGQLSDAETLLRNAAQAGLPEAVSNLKKLQNN